MLGIYWFFNSILLLKSDIEANPGPETHNFCTWNLNSIIAYDFIRAPLLEACNLVYNYDLIGIVEAYLDNTIYENRMAIN